MRILADLLAIGLFKQKRGEAGGVMTTNASARRKLCFHQSMTIIAMALVVVVVSALIRPLIVLAYQSSTSTVDTRRGTMDRSRIRQSKPGWSTGISSRRTGRRMRRSYVVLDSSCGRTDFDGGAAGLVPPTPYTFMVRMIDDKSNAVQFDRLLFDPAGLTTTNISMRSVKGSMAATATWRWCRHFVVPHGLCPWASGSVSTEGALQIFLVDELPIDRPRQRMMVLNAIANRFRRSISTSNGGSSIDPNKAIFFVVFLHETMMDFEAFYDSYIALEDEWELGDHVTLAPFHPSWTYGDDNDPLCMEKRSPYPLVSLVATRVIDQAGEAATQRIAATNEQTLRQNTAEEWETIYNTAIDNQDYLRHHTDWQ
jgi:hypothetical protein